MKKITILLFVASLFLFTSCDSESDSGKKSSTEKDLVVPPSRDKRIGINDLVLLYSGNNKRLYTWDEETLPAYIATKDEAGKYHWMFDGFLLLDLLDGDGHMYASGYDRHDPTLVPARKQEWELLLEDYLGEEKVIRQIDKCVDKYMPLVGKPLKNKKHRVVISIPEPIPNQKNWGEVDGKKLDFSVQKDRITACRWYIDEVIKRFNAANYKNVELAGFYWLAEESTNTHQIIKEVARYIEQKRKNYNLVWIPYFNADGALKWKSLGFHKAYLQPNYFFNESTPRGRLDQACRKALDNDMSLEMEFDEKVLDKYGWGYRFDDYMDAYEEYKIWETKELAYYQGGAAVYLLWKSDKPKEQALYKRFASYISKRQRDGIKK